MIALLYETVSSFENTWIECLGDLARYHMTIEDDLQDREVWNKVARFWYSKGGDKDPDQGRLLSPSGRYFLSFLSSAAFPIYESFELRNAFRIRPQQHHDRFYSDLERQLCISAIDTIQNHVY